MTKIYLSGCLIEDFVKLYTLSINDAVIPENIQIVENNLKNTNNPIFLQFIKDVYLSGCIEIDFIKLNSETVEHAKILVQPEVIQAFKDWLIKEGVYDQMKCSECHKILNRNEFNKPNVQFNSFCKTCEKKKHEVYWKNHKKEKFEYMIDYNNREENIDRMKTYGNSPTTEQIVNQISTDIFPHGNKVVNGQVKCHYCGQWFIPTFVQIKSRLRVLQGNCTLGTENNLYCSKECKQACPTYSQIWTIKGTNQRTLTNEVSTEFRYIVLERDNYTCQKCDKSKFQLSTALHVHHIVPKADDPMIMNDTNNGITLCKECHIETHKQPGCTYHEIGDFNFCVDAI